jgi:hypothetical protein
MNPNPDLLESSRALLAINADGVASHPMLGDAEECLRWCVDEIDRLRALQPSASIPSIPQFSPKSYRGRQVPAIGIYTLYHPGILIAFLCFIILR